MTSKSIPHLLVNDEQDEEEGLINDDNYLVQGGKAEQKRIERQGLLATPPPKNPNPKSTPSPNKPTNSNQSSTDQLHTPPGLAFKKKKGTARHIKFSHLFSVLLDIIVLASVVYVCVRVDKYWFTFKAPIPPPFINVTSSEDSSSYSSQNIIRRGSVDIYSPIDSRTNDAEVSTNNFFFLFIDNCFHLESRWSR